MKIDIVTDRVNATDRVDNKAVAVVADARLAKPAPQVMPAMVFDIQYQMTAAQGVQRDCAFLQEVAAH